MLRRSVSPQFFINGRKGKGMRSVRIKAYAKLNLTLAVTGEEGGYHQIDSLVASIDLCDEIVLSKRKGKLSSVVMHGQGSESIPPERNNALKAAEAFSAEFGVEGADIVVYKNIPIGAGLGGSSADISGVINGMAKLYGVKDKARIEALAERLGSDTKYMLYGGYMRMQGRGEKLTALPLKNTLHFLLFCPKGGVSAGACYKKYDELSASGEHFSKNDTQNCIDALLQENVESGGRYLFNDLFAPAQRLCPEVGQAYKEALSFSPCGAVMSGSGSAIAALFPSREFCEWAKSRYKGKCKTIVVKTVRPEDEKVSIFRNPFALTAKERGEED